ncbi:hypothetical protein TNCV_3980011 [Trichonephila clavipes]|nr:hypothetical protein TNCV_3980011 [Trichonephila clavipes]
MATPGSSFTPTPLGHEENVEAFTRAQHIQIHKRDNNFVLACLHPPRSPTREAVGRSSGAKTRHGAYLEYTQNIALQRQGEDPTGKPDTPHLQH